MLRVDRINSIGSIFVFVFFFPKRGGPEADVTEGGGVGGAGRRAGGKRTLDGAAGRGGG